jgi:Zn-dependent M28 family amino/carboxypeptidase
MRPTLMRGAVVALALLLQACASLPAAPEAAADRAAAGISAQRLSDHIRYLADDRLEGRYPGAVGEGLTLAYLQAQYEAMGYQPGGPDGQWLQPVELSVLRPLRAPDIAWRAGDGAPQPLDPVTQITARPPAEQPTVQATDAPVVFAGFGVVAPQRGWDDYGDVDVRGAVVVVLEGEPAFFGVDPDFYGSERHKLQEAARRGARAVLTLAASENQLRYRLRQGAAERNTIIGKDEGLVTGWIGRAVLDAWSAGAGQSADRLEAAARAGGFTATPLGARLSLDLAEATRLIVSHNLLARLPGIERPDQTVIYSAHWDHVGTASQPDARGDVIYNGAWDNASGTAGLLEIARAFKAGPAPARSVVFLHVTAEEMGLLGSAWYVRHPVYPLATTAADINIDMLPWSPATRDVALFGVGKSTLEDALAELAARQDRVVTGEGYPQEGFYYRSDHFNFAVAGVPAIMPWTGRDLRDGGLPAGAALYEGLMARYYHQRADEWRADYDFTAALENLQLFYRLGLDVAQRSDWPAWRPTAEFGAIRAASEAQRR